MSSWRLGEMMPENSGFYHAAYVVALVLYVGYAFFLHRRYAGLRRR
jgi:hypothetical protein